MSDDELKTCLGEVLGRPVRRLERRRSRYSTSFLIDDLDVELDDGSTLAMVRKDLSWSALLPEAVGTKPELLYDPLREIGVYRFALDDAGLGTAAFYGECTESHSGRYWLFIERVDGVELWQVGDFNVWLAVARWLARFHQAQLADDPRLRRHLIVYDGNFYRLWARRAEAFHRDADAGRRRRLSWVLRHHDAVIQRLVELPTNLIHGEFYASNVMVEFPGARRVCPIDWEMAAIGPALFDLAALVSGHWTSDQRNALALAYRDALHEGGCAHDHQSFIATLDLCRLHLCVRWLGWAPGWSPPEEHAQDWLGQSLEIAEGIPW